VSYSVNLTHDQWRAVAGVLASDLLSDAYDPMGDEESDVTAQLMKTLVIEALTAIAADVPDLATAWYDDPKDVLTEIA
jgi:hypothetical protein